MRIAGVTWSTTVALTTRAVELAARRELARPWRPRRRAAPCCASAASLVTSEPSMTWPRGSPCGSVRALAANFSTNASATFSSTISRSVDMQICPILAKQPNAAAFTASSRSASSRMTIGALPPSSSSTGLRKRAAVSAMMRPTCGRAGEVHAPHRRMRDQRLDHLGGIGRRVGHHVDDAGRQARPRA